MTSTSGVTTTYSYDQNGDTTGISSTTGVSTNLSYDSQARLSAVRLADGTTVVLAYNAQGQRVAYNVSKNGLTSEAEQLTYRGDELAQVAISNTLRYTDTYLYDPTGAPLELIRQTKNGGTLSTARYWYVLNGHGDVVALMDVTGTVVDSWLRHRSR